jgi:mono/diheme cytochrome c family protein
VRHRSHRSVLIVMAATLAVVLLAACKPGDPGRSVGAYPIDIFPEMHYSQSHKAQEPPRFMPPAESYPRTGGFIAVADIEDVANTTSPYPVDSTTVRRAALVFAQNCSMCHGLTGEGNGTVGSKFAIVQPPSFSDARITSLSPGEAYASIGGGSGFMPAFEGLLSEEDRWALVELINQTAQVRRAELDAVNGVDEITRTGELLQFRGIVE